MATMTNETTIDGLTRCAAMAMHDWVAFGFPYHTRPSTPSPIRRKHLAALKARGLIGREGPTDAGRKWVSANLDAILFN